MSIESVREFIKEKAQEFGAKINNEYNKPYIERNNTGQESLPIITQCKTSTLPKKRL